METTNTTQNTPKTTQSGALIGSNDDLLTEIFRRIPVRSVIRFKSVSKHLHSLLSDRRFTSVHDNLFTSPGIFICGSYIPYDVEDQTSPSFRSLDFCRDIHGIKIIQSCNGILLCCSDRGDYRSRKYYVFNPVTKQFAVIPPVGGRRKVYFMGLTFNPKDCDHYKVVCIFSSGEWDSEDREMYQIQIYYSKTGKWKTLNESFSGPDATDFGSGVYWNGAMHWAPFRLNPLYFDLNTEQLKTLPYPEIIRPNCYDNATEYPLYFGECGGHLHLVEDDGENFLLLHVYEMLCDHSGWVIKYEVDLKEVPVAYPEMMCGDLSSPYYYMFEIVDVVIGEKETDRFMVVRIRGRVLRFNIDDNSFKQIFDLPRNIFGNVGRLDVHRYTETLSTF